MGKTSSKVKDRYNLKAYDEIKLRVPKGRKSTVEAFAKEHEESVNGYINRLIRGDMGFTEQEWKEESGRE